MTRDADGAGGDEALHYFSLEATEWQEPMWRDHTIFKDLRWNKYRILTIQNLNKGLAVALTVYVGGLYIIECNI